MTGFMQQKLWAKRSDIAWISARSVRVPSPSLPLRLHKEKGGETLIFIAFLLFQISLFLSISIKALT
jgi:hypothetical protein